MKETSDSEKDGGPTALSRKAGPDLSAGLGPHLGVAHLGSYPHIRGSFGLPQNIHHQLHLAAGLTPHAASMLYPSLLHNNLNPAALMATLSGHDHMMRGRPPLPPLIPTSGTPPALANFHATLAAADISRHNDLYSLLKDSSHHKELLSALSKLAATSSTSTTSSTLSSSSLSSSSSPSSSSSLFHSHHDSPVKTEASPLDKRSIRSSSLSPSSYMTPRSLNGSPSTMPPTPNTGVHLLSPSTINSLAYGNETLSPPEVVGSSSPLGVSSRADTTSLTPMRKASTPRPDRVFTCKICNRSFGYKHVLQNHERTHTGEKPFECKECHKRFTRDHHLKTHMRLHTGEKPYHCSHCDRQFVQVANLRRHLRVHTGEKPYTCDSCPSRFSDSNQLKAHLLIHKGEKPFNCSKCMGRFRRRHHLLHHKCTEDNKQHEPLCYNSKDLVYSDSEVIPYRDIIYPDGEEEDNDDPDDDTIPPSTVLDDGPQLEKRRERKNKEPRRVIHHDPDPTALNITPPNENEGIQNPQLPPTPLPEQTEPEDLSINSSRSRAATYRANIALTTSGYAKHHLRYPKEEFMSDEEGSVPANL